MTTVYLIKASAPGAFHDYKRYLGTPPQNIFSAAACTPTGYGIEMTDETVDMKVNFRSKADIIAIFMSTPDAIHAYKIADKFRKNNKTVVFGGLHPTFMPDEALLHGDAVMIGETEGIWEQLLSDYTNGCLQKSYKNTSPVDLATLNPFPTNIIPKWRFSNYWSVVVGRGCNNTCDYCAVWPFFKKMRFRPVESIIEEIKACGTNYIELHADNLTADREYALNLFRELAKLNIHWSGETTLNTAEDKEMLEAMSASGCHFLLVGLETPSRAALDKAGKGFLSIDKVNGYVAEFHKYGIKIDSAFLFGFDEHTPAIFEETYEFVKEINLDSTHSVIVIPFAGTTLYKRLKREGRLLTEDWSKYDGVHAVFQPKHMTPTELEEGAWWFYQQTRKMGNNHIGMDMKSMYTSFKDWLSYLSS